MRRLVALSVVLLVLGAGPALAGRTSPILEPVVPIDAKTTPDQVWQAVRVSLNGLGWAPEEVVGNEMPATLHLRQHYAKIRLVLEVGKLSIRYVESKELLYAVDSKGVPVIHSNYNRWMNNLEVAIKNKLIEMGG